MKFKGALIGAGLAFLGVFFFSQPTVALSYQNTVGLEFNFDPLLNISLSQDALLIDGLAPGNTALSNTITITVNTTGITGYTLSAAVGNGTSYTDNNLTNLASPASPKPTFTSIPTNSAAVASLTTDNTWAYTLDSTNYYGLAYIHSVNNNDETWTVLNATKDVSGTAATSGCVGTCAGTANTTFTISARAAATQPSGDYTNVIQFKVISNPVPSTYSITYNSNTTDTVTNMPANVANTNTTDSTVTLSSNTPTRAGYTFGGWCTVQVTGNANCNGDTYAAGANMPIIVGANNSITLYTIWSVEPLDSAACPANSICYAPNAADIVGDMSSLGTTAELTAASPRAGKVSATANSTKELIAPNFKRAGYGFAGWSADFTATNSSVIYGPNELISTNPNNTYGADVSSGLVLYPVWVAPTGNLQGWSGCNSLAVAPVDTKATLSYVVALTDTRDGNAYTVARLADGLCWMVENLRLNAENSRGSENIAKAQGYGQSTTYGNFIGLADSEDGCNVNGSYADANSLYSINGNTTVNIGSSDANPEYRMPRYNNNNSNIEAGATNTSGDTLTDNYYVTSDKALYRWYGYGNYYTWTAAAANTGYFSSNTGTNGSDAAGTSICPFGWHLPLGYTSSGVLASAENDSANRVGGFSYLDRKMGGTGESQSSSSVQARKWRAFPNNFVYSGSYSEIPPFHSGITGEYWSSSVNGVSNAVYFQMGGSAINPSSASRRRGYYFAVRCVMGP